MREEAPRGSPRSHVSCCRRGPPTAAIACSSHRCRAAGLGGGRGQRGAAILTRAWRRAPPTWRSHVDSRLEEGARTWRGQVPGQSSSSPGDGHRRARGGFETSRRRQRTRQPPRPALLPKAAAHRRHRQQRAAAATYGGGELEVGAAGGSLHVLAGGPCSSFKLFQRCAMCCQFGTKPRDSSALYEFQI